MPPYSVITIIYNPNSTGKGRRLAVNLQRQLHRRLPGVPVKLHSSEYAGHAEHLAYDVAKTSEHPLILSSSGDGGYNEVVNGAYRAQLEGAKPVTGVLPAGNANDHYRNLHDSDLVDSIIGGSEKTIDLLKLETFSGGEPLVRFAHSYIGFGLTPQVSREINKTKLNPIKEVGIVLRVLLANQPVQLEVGGRIRSYDSLVLSNIAQMSKVINLSPSARPDDGKFEITPVYHRNKFSVVPALMKAPTTGLGATGHDGHFYFKTIKRTLVQLDGEVRTIDPEVTGTISLERGRLHCIV